MLFEKQMEKIYRSNIFARQDNTVFSTSHPTTFPASRLILTPSRQRPDTI